MRSFKFGGFAAGVADLFRSGLAELVGFHLDGRLHFATGKHFHGRAQTGQAAGVDVVKRDVFFAFKGFKQAVKIDHVVGNLERSILEAVLGQTALQGHLAAFEARSHTATGTGILAFVAHPILVLVAAALLIAMIWVVGPLMGPALWSGLSVKAALANVLSIARKRLVEVVLMEVVLYVILGLVCFMLFAGLLPATVSISESPLEFSALPAPWTTCPKGLQEEARNSPPSGYVSY